MVWNVAGELVNLKNITVGSKSPSLVMKAALCRSSSTIWTVLYPHLSLPLPVPPPWVQWSNELAREMYVKRALEKLKLEYSDLVLDLDYLTLDP